MTRLSDAFDRLIASRPPGDPDEALATARRRADAARSRQRVLLGVGTAAAVVALVVAAVVVTSGDEPGDDGIRTVPGDTTTIASTSTTTSTATTTPTDTVTVEIYLSTAPDPDCTATTAVTREVPADDPLTGAVEALMAGPTDHEAAVQGLGSWFSEDTAGMLNGIQVDGDTAFVDFDDITPFMGGASTSCGSAALQAQLEDTIGQFGTIDEIYYSINGSSEAFYHWLQMDVPDGARPEPGS
ncbi:MAG: GerMN domain-containing protein [Actinobacteria bacterium]|nr:GerMN domain-containing protein [Actinomycetota bacterium]